ncbi:putative manganese-dependent inorganic diphosphatase [Chrysiogenes arsenatis]|uniref:putative manganese-dependent inorganic diphosphatase n=1 Tax=Chrysiogenes arsenatis TaxID=309797 RepID=UPI00042360CB|nr:putative manganese-dependent inorganic diphosphatase [Chrysiogenes arsenatis]
MSEIYVIGHKNPDTDSLCSAYAYAALKNRLDSANDYQAKRCGNVGKQSRFVFDRAGLTPPEFIADVFPRVRDIMAKDVVTVHEDTPIWQVMKNIDERKIRMTPVVDDSGRYRGVVSILEMANFFMTKEVAQKPDYLLRPANFPQVVQGHFHQEGDTAEFRAKFLVAAMPFERVVKHIELLSDKPVMIVGKRRDIIEHAIKIGIPAIILTGIEGEDDLDIDFSAYRGWVYVSARDTAETLRLLALSVPAKAVMNTSIPTVNPDQYMEETRDVLLKVDHKGVPVVRDGHLVGLVTRSNIIERAPRKLILVDHNEMTQAVDGAENSEICEIVDHHRLGTIRTKNPVTFYAKPVGSTCTLVYQLYRQHGVALDQAMALLLLSGVLADTVIMKSPTTTTEDVAAIQELSVLAGVDAQVYGRELFAATDGLKQREPRQAVTADFKMFTEFGVKFGAGQIEVVTVVDLPEVAPALFEALEAERLANGLDWAMLLITDIISEESVLLTTGYTAAEKLLRYPSRGDRQFSLPGVLSRKKQLLPEILRTLEELNGR